MPKKGKKGGKGGKGGKKGKKGKKGGGAKKAAKDASIKAQSEVNSRIWQTRVEIAEQAKHDFRDHAHKLTLENEELHDRMVQTERDTIDVVSYLKKQDQEKDKQMEKLIVSIKDLKKEHRKEKETLVDDFQQQIAQLDQNLEHKSHEVEVLQSELKLVKEFRRKRSQMQKELDDIKEAMQEANREQKDTLTKMEQKFFDEKMRLEMEANRKIAELADRAHSEAISNLDETTRSVYKENVRLTESLQLHMKECDRLKKKNLAVTEENESLQGDKEMNELVVREKVAKLKHQKEKMKELDEKVHTLELSLSHVVHEFDHDHKYLLSLHETETQSAKMEIAKLQRTIELKNREMNRVKKLAKNILDQRTELERFFLESLEQVKKEIVATRSQYRLDAQAAYQEKMLAANKGKADYPRIRTFNKSERSTNNVFKDLEAAEHLLPTDGHVDISDLTWEQKEKTLRLLFAKMNTAKERRVATMAGSKPQITSMPELSHHTGWQGQDQGDSMFLTQQQFDSGLLAKTQHSAPAMSQVMTF